MIITGVATQGYFGGNVQEWTMAYYLGYVFGSNTFFFKEKYRDVAKVTATILHFTFDEFHFIHSRSISVYPYFQNLVVIYYYCTAFGKNKKAISFETFDRS